MTPKESEIVQRAKSEEGQKKLKSFHKKFIHNIDEKYNYRNLSRAQKLIMDQIWRKLFPEEVRLKNEL